MTAITIRTLNKSDRAAFEAFLRPRIERSMFLLSNVQIAGLVNEGKPFQGDYVAAFDGNDIVGVVSHFWNGNLNMNAPKHLGELVDAALHASGRPVKGVIGPADQVAATIDHLKLELDPKLVMLDEHEWLYSLQLSELILPEPLITGELIGRTLCESDVDVAVKWMVAYRIEAVGEIESEKLWREVEDRTRDDVGRGGRWVLEESSTGELLAMTGFNAMLPEAVQVGGVYTPPGLRGRGYGRAVVAASLRDKRDEGATLSILFSGKKNVGAQRPYEAIGFNRIGEYWIMMFRR
jgi:uncharacterized protein